MASDLEEKVKQARAQLEENKKKLAEAELAAANFKEAEVRAEAAERSCNVLERNLNETVEEIENWRGKTADLENEIADMKMMSELWYERLVIFGMMKEHRAEKWKWLLSFTCVFFPRSLSVPLIVAQVYRL